MSETDDDSAAMESVGQHCKRAMATTIKEFDLAFPQIEEQKKVLKAFLCNNYFFAVLPTGYSKSILSVRSTSSLVYGALDRSPLVFF